MKMRNTKDLKLEKLKILVYGESGAGKTYLARTIKEPTLIISAESGLLSLKGTNIDVLNLSLDDEDRVIPKEKRIDKLGEIYKFLLTAEATGKYDWIYVDSITEISQNLLEKLYLEFDEKQGLRMWGEYSKKLSSIIKSFRDLAHYNVVFTALATAEKDDVGKRYIGIDVKGKLGDQLPQFLDLVLYLHSDQEGKRVIHTARSERYIAKDRSGALNPIEAPDLSAIANKIRKEA